MPVVVQLNFGAVIDQVKQKASLVVQQTAVDLEARAKEIVPVKTGHLRSTIQHTVTGDLTAQVDVGAGYAGFVEFGTSKQEAQPYLTKAAEEIRPEFIEKLTQITR